MQCRPGVEDQRAACLRVLDPVDLAAAVAGLGIAAGCNDDGDGGTGRKPELDAGQVAMGHRCTCLEQVTVDERQHGLGLGIAEAAVELQHRRPVGRQHEPGEEQTDKGRSAPRQLLEHGPVHLVEQALHLVVVETGHRPIGAHAARVRPLVAVVGALEVLSRCQWKRTRPVA